MNIVKVAFYQGANQALIDLGLGKFAAGPGEPGSLNPKKRRRAPGLSSVEADSSGMGMSGIDMPEMQIKGRPRVSDVALGNISPAGKKRLDGLQDALAAMDLALKGEYVDMGEESPAPKRKPARRAAPRPSSSPPAKPGRTRSFDEIADSNSGPLKSLFPKSPGLVDAMSRGLTSKERQIGTFPKAPGSAPSRAPSKPAVASKKPSDGKLKALFPNSPGLVDAMRLGLTAPISPRDFSDSPKASPPRVPNKPAVATNKPSEATPKKSEDPVNPMTRGLNWVYDNMI